MAFALLNVPESDSLPQADASVESLRATIASLEEQLASLYAEREANVGGAPGDDFGLVALYEEKLRAGARLHAELRETAAGLEAQLHDVYAEREAGHAVTDAAAETIAALTAQVEEFYALAEQAGGRPLHEVVESEASLLAQVEALYAEQAAPSALAEMVESLEAQVAALLEEKAALEQRLAHARQRTRAIVAALVDQSFAEPTPS